MSEEDKSNKEFEPTEQKLRKAREKGDVPRSTEVNAAMMYAGALLGLVMLTSFFLPTWLETGRQLLANPGQESAAARALWTRAAWAVVAFGTMPIIFIFLGLIVQRGLIFTPEKLVPKLSRINPISNAGQKFGKSGLVTFAISVSKATAIGVAGWFLFVNLLDLLIQSGNGLNVSWIAGTEHMIIRTLSVGLAASIVLSAFDLAWKHYDHRMKNKMSRKEMRDEHKDSEGDPHMKSARRQKAVDIVMSNMLADVEKADVVIVNPTHYAVALKWDRLSGRAPVCVAKGTDEVSARIRDRATKHKVPIWPDPPCARALHANVKIGQEIEREHFAPVAAAIRFSERMRKKAKQGW